MKSTTVMYKRHRFPPEIIQYAVWLYHRFNLSHRDIEDLLAERGGADKLKEILIKDGRVARGFSDFMPGPTDHENS
jgi:hypothetical protein